MTLLGQVATFIDNLHLSYKEVLEEIPYRNLVIMQQDKLRMCYGEKVKHTTGKEMMERRKSKDKNC